MVKRRRGPPARPSAAQHAVNKAGVVSAVPPAEAVAEVQDGSAPEGLPDVHATPDHAPSVHETLLETVSPEAIEVAAGEPLSADSVSTESPEPAGEPAEPIAAASDEASALEAAVPEESVPGESGAEEPIAEASAANDAHPAPAEPPKPVEAASGAAPVEDLTPLEEITSPEEAASPEETASLEDLAPPAPLDAAVAPDAAATVEAVTALAAVPETVAQSSRASLDMIGEIAEANATVLAFLRSEGSAAVAHWQSLSGAKTPADALRIQVDEMQRAADASLTCFAALARRAGRLASGIGRI